MDPERATSEWRQKANREIDSLVTVFRTIAVLASLGITWIALHSIFDLYDGVNMWITGDGIASICVFVPIAAAVALRVHRKIRNNDNPAALLLNDNDCKQSKVKREEMGRIRLWALFFMFLALLFSAQVIWTSMMTIQQEGEGSLEQLTVLPPDDGNIRNFAVSRTDDDDIGSSETGENLALINDAGISNNLLVEKNHDSALQT